MTDITAPDVVLTQRYANAVAYASALHADQTRKSTTIPYISHLIGVSSLVLEAGGDEDMAIAALLHDGPEDQGGEATLEEIREKFGDRVAHIVEGSTDSLAEDPDDKEPWRQRKEAYIAHLKDADDDSLTVSLADKLHNARAIVSDLMITGPSTWDRFNASPAEILWYYEEILNIANRRNANLFLRTNLSEVVAQMATPPPVDAPHRDIARYAMSFNAYEHWFGNLGTIADMVQPLQEEYDAFGKVPPQVGTDALRAWLFALVRSDRFSGDLAPVGDSDFVITDPGENPAVRAIVAELHARAQRVTP